MVKNYFKLNMSVFYYKQNSQFKGLQNSTFLTTEAESDSPEVSAENKAHEQQYEWQ